MRGKFYQYLCSLLFALLTVLGWYYGQLQQYVSVENNNELGFHFTIDICSTCDKSPEKSLILIKEHEGEDLYNISRPHYSKLRAKLSENENENENDENVETSASSDIAVLLRGDFWRLIFGFVITFHDKQNAVSFAHSEHLKLSYDDLYIQYRVIRL